jgi:hypothetical protein
MGYNSRMSRAVTFDPTEYGGIDFRDFKVEQGIESLRLVMRHLGFPGQPHKMFLITLDRLQHNSGLGTPILEDPHIWAPHLKGLWIPNIRQFLQRIDGSLTIADVTIQPLQRQHDYHVMDPVVTRSLFSPPEVRRINYCRLYLQVLTISDMCNATGDRLAPGIRHGQHLWSQSKSDIQEIHQERPNEASWTIWRRFLNTLSNFHGCLYHSLGDWLQPAAKLRRSWPTLYSPSSDSLYVCSGDQYEIHPYFRTRIYSYDTVATVRHQPEDGVPVDCSETSDGWCIPGLPSAVLTPLPPALAPTFDIFIDQQPGHIPALLPRIQWYCHDAYAFCDQASDLSHTPLLLTGE